MKPSLIVGNWKMNGGAAALDEARALVKGLEGRPVDRRIAICPPATLLHRLSEIFANTPVALGGQDCHPQASGPFTGDLSAEMLSEAGARYVILGHSERRSGHSESSLAVAAKAKAALRAGLEPIVCVGEALADRKSGRALEIVAAQTAISVLDWCEDGPFSIAYEPIWAIGSGLVPSIQEIEAVHTSIRGVLAQRLGPAADKVKILYGGSVNAGNAKAILAARDVGGALVGGASLRAADFLPIALA